MHRIVEFLLLHGYWVLWAAVLGEQLGIPVSAVPVMLAMGALAGAGRFSLQAAVVLAGLTAVAGDLIWFQLGRRYGYPILRVLCRVSLEPDSCARRTENFFARLGPRALLVAKFLPGFSTAAPPMAGMFRMSLWHFVPYDIGGALLWTGVWSGAGYVFSAQLERAAAFALRLGTGLLVLMAGSLALYIAWKYVQRRRFLRQLRASRITPEELKIRLDAGEPVTVVDLRHSVDFDSEPQTIPGALHLLPQELSHRHLEIPRDREIILYCT